MYCRVRCVVVVGSWHTTYKGTKSLSYNLFKYVPLKMYYEMHYMINSTWLTKPVEIGDFFTLVSMTLPYFCPKGNILVILSVVGSRYSFTNNHNFSSIFAYKELPCSWKFDVVKRHVIWYRNYVPPLGMKPIRPTIQVLIIPTTASSWQSW